MKWLMPIPLMVLLAGCGSSPDVVVVDRSGAPVAGAAVEAVSHTINYTPSNTDEDGEASLPQRAMEVKWLNVTAPGFKKAHVDYTGGKPQTVVLDR